VIRRLLIIAALIALPTTASAATLHAGERVGTFDARGSGTLIAQGKLTAYGRYTGTIIVRDPIGTAVVRLNGVRQRPRTVSKRIRIYSVTARASRAFYVQGNNVNVQIRTPRSRSLSISMFGRARVTRLAGIGRFAVNSGDEATWASARTPLQVAPVNGKRARPDTAKKPDSPTSDDTDAD